MIILGIDPGLNHTGWGVIRKQGSQLSFVACGVVSVPANAPLAKRLVTLSTAVAEVIHAHQPDSAAIEETFATPNGASTLKLGQARGALLLTLAQAGLEVGEYSALHVKKAVVGVGRAEKQQVAQMVALLLPGARDTLSHHKHDASDALAIAICHGNHTHFL
jgi:crossover junction endodeoxyribonuclease RuvC